MGNAWSSMPPAHRVIHHPLGPRLLILRQMHPFSRVLFLFGALSRPRVQAPSTFEFHQPSGKVFCLPETLTRRRGTRPCHLGPATSSFLLLTDSQPRIADARTVLTHACSVSLYVPQILGIFLVWEVKIVLSYP